MNTEIRILGSEWERKNEEYDGLVRLFLDDPSKLSVQQVAEIKKLQKELYDLESKIFLTQQ